MSLIISIKASLWLCPEVVRLGKPWTITAQGCRINFQQVEFGCAVCNKHSTMPVLLLDYNTQGYVRLDYGTIATARLCPSGLARALCTTQRLVAGSDTSHI